MTTLENDMIRWSSPVFGTMTMRLSEVGLEWPPPKFIIFGNYGIREPLPGDPPDLVLRRAKMSELTDEIAAGSKHIGRGAEYVYPFQEEDYELYKDVTYLQ